MRKKKRLMLETLLLMSVAVSREYKKFSKTGSTIVMGSTIWNYFAYVDVFSTLVTPDTVGQQWSNQREGKK